MAASAGLVWHDEHVWAFLISRRGRGIAEDLCSWAEDRMRRYSEPIPDPASEIGKLLSPPIPTWVQRYQAQLGEIRQTIEGEIAKNSCWVPPTTFVPGQGTTTPLRQQADDAINGLRAELDPRCGKCFDLGDCLVRAQSTGVSRSLPSVGRELKRIAQEAGVPEDWLDDVKLHLRATSVASRGADEALKMRELDRTIEEFDERLVGHLEQMRHGELHQFAHGPDFRSVRWCGTFYSFTPLQAKIVAILWDAWEQRTYDVGDDFLLREAKSDQTRLVDVLKGHSAWGTMIVRGNKKGTARLSSTPDSVESP